MTNAFSVIIPAAGRSTRFGDALPKKIFVPLGGNLVWERSVSLFQNRADVIQIIVAIAPKDRKAFESSPRFSDVVLVDGGHERVDSIRAALARVDANSNFIAVHDAARPCATAALIDRVFAAAIMYGAALPGIPVSDTLKSVDEHNRVVATVPRAGLVAVQTPQAFRRDWLQAAYAQSHAGTPTDDAQLVELLGHSCHVVEGSPLNLKITRPEDLILAEAVSRLHNPR